MIGVVDGITLGGNVNAFVKDSTVPDAGTVTTTFTYLNNKAPSDWPKEMAEREVARTPNTREFKVRQWYLKPIARAAADSKEEKKFTGTWNSSIGQLDLDQCGTCVAGTVHFKSGVRGPLVGIGGDGLNFDCFDGTSELNNVQASPTKEGGYTGFYNIGRKDRTPFTLSH